MSRKNIAVTLSASAVAIVLGCSGGSKGHISLSATTGGTPSADAGTAAAAGLDLGNGVVLTRVRMIVRKVEVEGDGCTAPTSMPPGTTAAGGMAAALPALAAAHETPPATTATGDGDDDRCEVEGGPFLMDLGAADLSGPSSTLSFVADLTVPDGTYRKVEFKVNTIPDTLATTSGLQAMNALHASIAVDGTVDGTAFEFTTPMSVEQKVKGTFTVDATHPANLTLSVDPTGWFGGTGSARLDPNDATARGEILENIRASIRLFHDDDHDGCDDDLRPPSTTGVGWWR